jgi:hypothetical protein
MGKDLIIGGTSNYTWDQLKYWINSIRMSGFEGDVALVATNITKETIDILTSKGVKLHLYGKRQPNGDFLSVSNNAPHVERFFYIMHYLMTTNEKYRYVITTDTRDVIFQKNPSEWLEANLYRRHLVASSEGILYENEPWGNQNLLDAFGPFFHQHNKSLLIYNVGVVAGEMSYVRDLLAAIFHLSVNRPIKIVDQAVFNMIINLSPWYQNTFFAKNDAAWAIQLGTTIEAVKAGKGDLGMMLKNDATKYASIYEDTQPIFDGNLVKNSLGEEFSIVHQYDRVPALKLLIEQKYGDM